MPEPRTDSNQPAIRGEIAVLCLVGYLMMACRFRNNFVSTGDLNRSPGVERAAALRVLLVLFVQAKRIKRVPFREARGFANLEAAHKNGGFANPSAAQR